MFCVTLLFRSHLLCGLQDGTKTTQKRTSGKKNPKEELSQDEATIKRLKASLQVAG